MIYTPEQLLNEYSEDFYRLTNEEEYHRGFQYQTGLNTDFLPFNPSGFCQAGGLYFFHASQLPMYKRYCDDSKFIRKVSFTTNSRIYKEDHKFKTNEFILDTRKDFDENKIIEILCTPEFCKLAVQQDGKALKYVKDQTLEICELALQEDGRALKYVKNQTEELCKLAVQQNGFILKYVNEQTAEICELAVQQNGYALEYVKNQTDEICKLAVQENGYALEYVKEQTVEICKLAIKEDNKALQFVKNQSDEFLKLIFQ